MTTNFHNYATRSMRRVARAPTLEVGISIVPYADSIDRSRELVRIADEGGLRLVGIQDDPYQRRFLDTFALWNSWRARSCRCSPITSPIEEIHPND
jgi:hypothetical protein